MSLVVPPVRCMKGYATQTILVPVFTPVFYAGIYVGVFSVFVSWNAVRGGGIFGRQSDRCHARDGPIYVRDLILAHALRDPGTTE